MPQEIQGSKDNINLTPPKVTRAPDKVTKMLSLNIRSIRNKVNQFSILLDEVKPDIVLLNEHWLHGDEIKYYKNLEDYTLVSFSCRSVTEGGGTAIYIKNEINVKNIQYENIKPIDSDCEFSCCEVTVNKKLCTIISIYRAPNGDLKKFIEVLSLLLEKIFKTNKLLIISGDFNVDFINENDKNAENIINWLETYNLEPHVKKPTRVTSTSSTALDNIFISKNVYSNYKILKTDISDHYTLVFDIPSEIQRKNCIFSENRVYSTENLNNFFNMISLEHWSEIYNLTDVNLKYENFFNTFWYYFEVCFPLKRRHSKTKKTEGWVTPELRHWSQKLRDLYELYKNTGCQNVLEKYNSEKKLYKKYINDRKKSHNDNIIMNSQNKTKSTWKLVNRVLNKESSEGDKPIVLANNGHMISDPSSVANLFCSYFQNEPRNTTNNLNLGEPHVTNLFFKPTNPDEVRAIIMNLPPKYSTGFDGIPTIVLKKVAEIICHPLAEIINACLGNGVFPDSLKISKVIPVFKKGERDDIKNYRPVSLLSIFSKIFERIIYIRLLDYFTVNNIFVLNQHGFLPKKSTITAIFESLNFIIQEYDKKNKIAGIYFDLTKAFDSMDHSILLEKLEFYGIRGIANQLIKSYLSRRIQRVCLKTVMNGNSSVTYSNDSVLNVGVPQGSILGPLFFLIFVNDLTRHINIVSLIQYADDISAIIVQDNVRNLSIKATQVSEEISEWCYNNLLQLNEVKTNLIYFKNNSQESLYVKLNGKSIIETNTTKFLGVTLDNELSWSEHINNLQKRLSSACCAIRFVRDQLGADTLKQIYFAYFQSLIQYGVIFWYHSADSSKIFILQKRIIRTMLFVPPMTSCRNYFRKLGILTFTCIYIYHIALYAKNNIKNFLENSDINTHCMSTRGENSLSIPVHRTALFEKGAYYNCVKIYNALPHDIKQTNGNIPFKKKLKRFLIDKSFYSLNEFYSDS